MLMTDVSSRLSPAILPNSLSVSRLVSVKYAPQRLPVFVFRSARASYDSVETNPSVDSVIEKEEKNILLFFFEMAKEYLKHVLGGNIIDASCGSGMFSRLFGKSEHFAMVFALDYSENMLRQCYEFLKQEANLIDKKIVVLARADVARLPFLSGSVDAVHAGAALHCWPSPSSAVAEISRVLRPGGVFVATTFIYDGLFRFIPFLEDLRQEVMRYSGSHMFLSERELEDLCKSCGLVGFTCVRNGLFIMLSATKPSQISSASCEEL
nr:PREDICTED: uncharacterized methyltransferase At1g78140, chloroplastic-like [Raphanus sativus]